jgi:hydroxyacyl-ACP dehydratase HTD2-like protein with hotdog domain
MNACEWGRVIDHDRYARLVAILRTNNVPETGPLPPTWHWLYTHESPIDAPLRRDGHVAVLPHGVPETHSRRLWTGSEIQIHRHTCVGTHSTVSAVVQLDEVSLFRYSALLGVCHRIHYDHPYATSVERYPGLVVHGPLVAQMLVFHARALAACDDVHAVRVVSHRPSFAGEPLRLCAARCEQRQQVVAWAEGPDGCERMHVELTMCNQ